ncbi:hypothetical protein AX17_005490 [Amanita inopinata Kibby_2008]|nr:hypothetical protein AX17_005490 [Amanita inopinata Kibby_2008]
MTTLFGFHAAPWRSVKWLSLLTTYCHCSLLILSALATEYNVTIDDTNPAIQYLSPPSWSAQNSSCFTSTDSKSMDAFNCTWHEGANLLHFRRTRSDDGQYDDSDYAARDSTVEHRSLANVPVTMSFNFTGTAMYLYCIQPPISPYTSNLSFTLDGQPLPPYYQHSAKADTHSLIHVNVLSQKNLSNKHHMLVMTVEAGSVVLIDYLVYTRSEADLTTGSLMASIGLQNMSGLSTDSNSNRSDVVRIAAAIGVSIGVITLIAIVFAVAVIRRHLRHQERQRRHGHLRRQSTSPMQPPPVSGPEPFVPRYFPGTVLPSEPPSYDTVSTFTGRNSGVLNALRDDGFADRLEDLGEEQDLSYAEVPPPSPPPPLALPEDVLPPPPPFMLNRESSRSPASSAPGDPPSSPPGLTDHVDTIANSTGPLRNAP